MIRFFLLLALFLPSSAWAQNTLSREYGEATTLAFCLYRADGSGLEEAATFSSGDILLMKDEGAETNITTLPTDEGNCYSVPLTANETQCARCLLVVSDQTDPQVWLDKTIRINTYGDSAATHSGTLQIASDGLIQSSTATTAVLAAAESYNNDDLIDSTISILSGTGKGQSRCISDNVQSSDTVTISDSWNTQPNSTSSYKIYPGCSGGDLSGTVDANIIEVAGSSVSNVNAFKADVSTVSTFDPNTDQVVTNGITSAAANKVADHVLRRNSANVEGSSDGDTIAGKSLYGAVAKQTHKILVSGGSLITYRSDNSTQLTSQTVTTNSAAAPITGVE